MPCAGREPPVIELRCIVSDDFGFHARPIVQLASIVREHKSSVSVLRGTTKADGADVMTLMGLEARAGDELIFQIEGSDETQLAHALCELSFLDSGA